MRDLGWPQSPREDSHVEVFRLVQRGLEQGFQPNLRAVVVREDEGWKPACGRIDLCRPGDAPPVTAWPQGDVRILDEQLSGDDLVHRLFSAFWGRPLRVAGEDVVDHGIGDVQWRASWRPDWRDYGTSWPCIEASTTTGIPLRPHRNEVIDAEGSLGVFKNLEEVAWHAMAFSESGGPGYDSRVERFNLFLWDYRGRIARFERTAAGLELSVDPKNDPSFKLIGRVGETVVKETAPSTLVVPFEGVPWQIGMKLLRDGETVDERACSPRMEGWTLEDDDQLPGYSHDDAVVAVSDLLERFHLYMAQLQSRRHADRPTIEVNDEYDVQHFLHALLAAHFEDVRAEEYTPSYGGKSSRMDILLKREKIVIETKMTRSSLPQGRLRDQLIVDIDSYRVHPDCKTLFCFVWDPERRVKNPRGFEEDLSRQDESSSVLVFVSPP